MRKRYRGKIAADEETWKRPGRMRWAQLLKRVFEFDIHYCQCGGTLKLTAIITSKAVIERFLTAIGIDPRPPPIAPARFHDQGDFDFAA